MTYLIECNRAGGSIFGAASALLKSNGKVQRFETREEAEAEAKRLNERATPNCSYRVIS